MIDLDQLPIDVRNHVLAIVAERENLKSELREAQKINKALSEQIHAVRFDFDSLVADRDRHRNARKVLEGELADMCHARDNAKVECDRVRATVLASRRLMATHRCKVCSTLWIEFPPNPENPALKDGWFSVAEFGDGKPGPCCDNEPMGEQLELLPHTWRAQLAAANADRDRLDLVEKCWIHNKQGTTNQQWGVVLPYCETAFGPSLRAAIDAAALANPTRTAEEGTV